MAKRTRCTCDPGIDFVPLQGHEQTHCVCKCGWTLLSKRSSKKLKARKGSKTKKVFVKDHVLGKCTWLTLPIKRQHTDGNCSEHHQDTYNDDTNNNNCSKTGWYSKYSNKYSGGNSNYTGNSDYTNGDEDDEDSTLHTAAHRPGRASVSPRKRSATPWTVWNFSLMFSCIVLFCGIATLSGFSSLKRLPCVPGLVYKTDYTSYFFSTIERFNVDLSSIGHRVVENISQVAFAHYDQWGVRTLARNLAKFLKPVFNPSHAPSFANATSSSTCYEDILAAEADDRALSVFRVPI